MSQSFKWKTNPFKISWNLKISVPRLCYCSIYDIECMISAASKDSNKPTSTGTSGSHRFLDCQLSALEQTMYTVGSIIIHASIMSSHFWSPNIYTSTPLDKFSRVPPMRIWMMFLDLGSELYPWYHRTATTRQQTSFKKTHAAVWAVGHISSSAPTAHGKLNS